MLAYAGIRTVLVKDGIIPKLVKLLKKAQFRHVALTLVKSSVALLYSLYY
jgi:hypothetical protein